MEHTSADVTTLRPQKLSDYVGQENAIKTLQLFIDAVKKRGNPSEHILFYGPPGIGKTTLSFIISNELEGSMKVTSGAAISKSADLAAIITNLQDNDVLFIDEIHRLPKPVEEMLYPVMEDYSLDIIIGKGAAARTVRLPVPKITIIGATTKMAMLAAPLRDRFGLMLRLDYYSMEEMEHIIKRSSQLLNLIITEDSAKEIAKRSRGTPRIANRILKRAKDVVDVHKHEKIDKKVLDHLFELLELDEMGLSDLDLQYLRLIAEKFNNTPVGVATIASSLSEDRQTIEEFTEPYLLQIGFIKKTSRGRVITHEAAKHLKITIAQDGVDQQTLV